MSSHDVERAYVQARLDHAEYQLNEASAAMRADLDRLAESWRQTHGQQLADHETRMRQMRDDQAAWLNSLYGDDDEPAPTQDVARGQVAASAAGFSPASPPGPGPGQLHPHPDPHAADMALARSISAMSMQEYAERRAELGVQSPTSMSRLFGH